MLPVICGSECTLRGEVADQSPGRSDPGIVDPSIHHFAAGSIMVIDHGIAIHRVKPAYQLIVPPHPIAHTSQ
eukprot:scaffold2963_cov250-Pinguiococcus_pyrenoidosus.AAC.5